MTRRLLLVTGVLILSCGLRVWLGAAATIPAHEPLADFPSQLGKWKTANEGALSGSLLSVLLADDYILRRYRDPAGQSADLFIAYYRTERAGENMHSPKNCMPGSGWEPIETDRLSLGTDEAGQPLWVNRYVVEKDGQRELVLYWYQAHGRVIASEYWGKIYLVWDSLRSRRRDGALVRISLPIPQADDSAAASNAALDLARTALPYLPRFLPN